MSQFYDINQIGAWSAPSQYMNECLNIVNWTLRNKLQWKFYRISYIFIQENEFETAKWQQFWLGLNVLIHCMTLWEGLDGVKAADASIYND